MSSLTAPGARAGLAGDSPEGLPPCQHEWAESECRVENEERRMAGAGECKIKNAEKPGQAT